MPYDATSLPTHDSKKARLDCRQTPNHDPRAKKMKRDSSSRSRKLASSWWIINAYLGMCQNPWLFTSHEETSGSVGMWNATTMAAQLAMLLQGEVGWTQWLVFITTQGVDFAAEAGSEPTLEPGRSHGRRMASCVSNQQTARSRSQGRLLWSWDVHQLTHNHLRLLLFLFAKVFSRPWFGTGHLCFVMCKHIQEIVTRRVARRKGRGLPANTTLKGFRCSCLYFTINCQY